MRDPKLQQIFDNFFQEVENYISSKTFVKEPTAKTTLDFNLDDQLSELGKIINEVSEHKETKGKSIENLISLLEGLGSVLETKETVNLEEILALTDRESYESELDLYIDKLNSLQSSAKVASMDTASSSDDKKGGIAYALDLLKKYRAKISS
ncbi:MAG: hypothetical protein IT416_04350 [Candidatus Pacebacteria bacterium]|nr:hypothetical protein [Candidatus Paceibacterota bacterium]